MRAYTHRELVGTTRLKSELADLAQSLVADQTPFVYDLVTFLQTRATDYLSITEIDQAQLPAPSASPLSPPTPSPVPAPQSAQELCVALVRIDHMRQKAKYIKTIIKWWESLKIRGRIFFHRHIYLLMEAPSADAISQYVQLNRSAVFPVLPLPTLFRPLSVVSISLSLIRHFYAVSDPT